VEKFLIELQSKTIRDSLMFYAKKLTYYDINESEDLLQETYLKAIDKKDKYTSEKADLKHWMISIMHNIYVDKKRKGIIENKMYSTSLYKEQRSDHEGVVDEIEELSIFDDTYNPLEILENREFKDKLKMLKKNLRSYIKNEKMYTIVMARLMGIPFLEIERMFGINVQAGKSLYFRFREVYADKLKKEFETYI
jgi:RNA polymerase sigma factor (sigma-70 family)